MAEAIVEQGASAAAPAPEVKTPVVAAQADETLLGSAGVDKPVVDAAKTPTPEEKAVADAKAVKDAEVVAENKKLLEADDKTLTPEQLAKKAELKTAAEKATQDAKDNVVPETYAMPKLPEGIAVNQELLDGLTPMLKEAGITQAKFNKLIPVYAEIIGKQTQAALKAQEENSMKVFNQIKSEWKAETDKVLGAEPAKETAFAGKFLNKYGSKELRQALNETGMGNHPELVKAFIAAGRAISEDTMPKGPTVKPGGDGGGLDPSKFYTHPSSPK